MRCVFCGSLDSKVLDSRPADNGYAIRRRRECIECKKRFTTYEKIEQMPLVVVKKNGERDLFDREKLVKGLFKACEKTNVPYDTIETIAAEIERDLLSETEKEISSQLIGEKVMDALQSVDPVAYVRFASVYREFKDVETFMNEIETLLKNTKNDSINSRSI